MRCAFVSTGDTAVAFASREVTAPSSQPLAQWCVRAPLCTKVCRSPAWDISLSSSTMCWVQALVSPLIHRRLRVVNACALLITSAGIS